MCATYIHDRAAPITTPSINLLKYWYLPALPTGGVRVRWTGPIPSSVIDHQAESHAGRPGRALTQPQNAPPARRGPFSRRGYCSTNLRDPSDALRDLRAVLVPVPHPAVEHQAHLQRVRHLITQQPACTTCPLKPHSEHCALLALCPLQPLTCVPSFILANPHSIQAPTISFDDLSHSYDLPQLTASQMTHLVQLRLQHVRAHVGGGHHGALLR